MTKEKEIESNYRILYEQEREAHKKTKIKLGVKERELHTITQSNSYKIAKLLALTKHAIRLTVNQVKRANPKYAGLIRANKRHVEAIYNSRDFIEQFPKNKTAQLAVVIHLYYVDMLPIFDRKLKRLKDVDFDLFVTIPEGKEFAVEDVKKAFPHANTMIVPNCGRDVLPFVEVAKQLNSLGYEKVLKLHSKKSPHRQDGSKWRDRILDSLIPSDKTVLNEISKSLDNKNVAIIGPQGEYVSLLVNYEATGHYIEKFFTKIISDTKIPRIIDVSDEYGFFAGTMFWARLDALMPVIDAVDSRDFEPEMGQVDSTLAHALERLLCLIPELHNRKMLEMKNDKVVEVNYHTTNIPEWSEIALKD